MSSRIVVPSSSAYTFEQNIYNLNCLATHVDVVSLEKSTELGDESSSFTCPILNHSGDASHVMLKQCNLRVKIGSNLALYCITRLTYILYNNDGLEFIFIYRYQRIETEA